MLISAAFQKKSYQNVEILADDHTSVPVRDCHVYLSRVPADQGPAMFLRREDLPDVGPFLPFQLDRQLHGEGEGDDLEADQVQVRDLPRGREVRGGELHV